MTVSNLLNDRYQIIADLNKGSYGVVYLAKDYTTGDLCAVKCIVRNSSSQCDDEYDEALQEIAMHHKLGDHKNIAKLLDHFEANSKTYLVMEYYANGDLYEAIKAGKGPREQGNILEFMLQLIEAVKYCHSKGVYHRDIKPENVLIANDGTVKLADWGLATVDKDCKDFGAGSERYMAPELFDHANLDYYDAKAADIWSVGIVLLNILFGRNPFTVASQKDKLFIDFATSREALFDIFPTLSTDVFSVLRHALTIDPDNRSLDKMSMELTNVQVWTTDEEFYDYEEVLLPAEDSSVPVITEDNADGLIVTTTDDRQPFRTPSAFVDVTNTQSFVSNYNWDRTLQFTPPTKDSGFNVGNRILNSNYYHNNSATTKVPSGLSHLYSSNNIEEGDENTGDADHGDASSDEDVFAMDSLSNSVDKISLVKERNASGSDSSISSLPSLVTSSTSASYKSGNKASVSTLSKSSIKGRHEPSTTSTPIQAIQGRETIKFSASLPANHRDYFKFGKSWSEIDFDDDNDDCDDNEFFEIIKRSLPTGAAKFKMHSEAQQQPTIAQYSGMSHW